MENLTMDASVLSRFPGLSLTLTGVLVIVLTMLYSYWMKESWRNLPPGPLVLPFTGSGLPIMWHGRSLDMRKGFNRLAGRFGELFTVQLGTDRAFIISGYSAIKEAMTKFGTLLADRPNIFAFEMISYGGYGIIGTSGDLWQEQRRYVLHVLRNFGFGRNRIHEIIHEEIKYFIDEMHTYTNRDINLRPHFAKASSNIIGYLAFGFRHEYDDPVFQNYMQVIYEVIVQIGGPKILTIFPWLRFVPGMGRIIGYTQLKENLEKLYGHYQQMIATHKQDLVPGQPPKDLIDSYLIEIEKRKHDKSSTFSEKELLGIIHDLFVAATDSTSTTISWLVIYLVKYPEAQQRIHNELHETVSADHVIRWEERSNFPYTEAFIAEVMRISSVVPLVAPHAPREDIVFRGYTIPRGAMVMMNTYSVDMDPEIWENPEDFNPDRFLDSEGQYRKRDAQLTFGTGKRACLGEGLARTEVFLFLVAMLQRFRFITASDGRVPDVYGISAALYQPKPFKVVVQPYSHTSSDT